MDESYRLACEARDWLRREDQNKPTCKANIKDEIFKCIGRGADNYQSNGYKFSPEAEAVFQRMRKSGIPWNGNEWQINQAIQEAV